MKRIEILCAAALLTMLLTGCGEEEPPAVLAAPPQAETDEKPPVIVFPEIVEPTIVGLTDADGKAVTKLTAGKSFTVAGSFRKGPGKDYGAPAVIMLVRDKNGIVNDSISDWSEKQDDGRYTFQGSMDNVSRAGTYTLEIRIRGNIVQQQEIEFQ
jgi:hypothetical protein